MNAIAPRLVLIATNNVRSRAIRTSWSPQEHTRTGVRGLAIVAKRELAQRAAPIALNNMPRGVRVAPLPATQNHSLFMPLGAGSGTPLGTQSTAVLQAGTCANHGKPWASARSSASKVDMGTEATRPMIPVVQIQRPKLENMRGKSVGGIGRVLRCFASTGLEGALFETRSRTVVWIEAVIFHV